MRGGAMLRLMLEAESAFTMGLPTGRRWWDEGGRSKDVAAVCRWGWRGGAQERCRQGGIVLR